MIEPDRMPPRSQEAERAVLGSMIRDNTVIADVLGILHRDSFYEDAHQKIFAAIVALWDMNKPADRVTLAEKLLQLKHDEDIGGLAYIQTLWEAAPTAANAVHYAYVVRDRALVRKLIHVGNEILRDAYNQVEPPEEMLGTAERKILGIADAVEGETFDSEACGNAACQRIEERCRSTNRGVTGVPTGFTDLDSLTSGFQNGEFIILAARPSVGKTALASAFALNAAVSHGIPTLFLSLEQSRLELTERMLVSMARANGQHVRGGYPTGDELMAIAVATQKFREAPLYINDRTPQRILQIKALARRQKNRNRIGLVVIDYVQLIEPDSRREPRHEQVAAISRQCKYLARELNIPVVVCAQLNREVEGRPNQRPRLSDLKESGALEQDADTVLLIHRLETESPSPTRMIEVIIAKQRNGPVGDVKLVWLPDQMRYESYAPYATPFDSPRLAAGMSKNGA